LHAEAAPVLVREGFSWGAMIFGPLWLFAHRSWTAGVLALAVAVGIVALPAPSLQLPLGLLLAWVLGLWAQDWRRWSLARRGYLLAHVVAAPDADAAFARLLTARPDLAGTPAA
jgi:hypothetical protein